MYGTVMKKEDKAKELNQKINDQMKKYEKKSDVKALLVYGIRYLFSSITNISIRGYFRKNGAGKISQLVFQK